LLSECLMSAVRRDEVLPGDSLELAWTVRNDGRISKAECMPPIKELGVWSCFKNALRLFRYPRFTGQRQNITLPLAVQR
jgi:hypothetical protein